MSHSPIILNGAGGAPGASIAMALVVERKPR
jgi:hypothetical protein